MDVYIWDVVDLIPDQVTYTDVYALRIGVNGAALYWRWRDVLTRLRCRGKLDQRILLCCASGSWHSRYAIWILQCVCVCETIRLLFT